MRLQNKNLYWPKTKALFKFLKGYVACRGAIAFIITWYKPEFPFWDQERHHSTPVWPVRDTVKRFFIGSTPDGLPAAAAQPKIASFVAYFCNTSPYPNQVIDGFPC